MDKKPTAFLFDLYKQTISQTNERKTTLNHSKKVISFMNQFSNLSQFVDSEPLEGSEGHIPKIVLW